MKFALITGLIAVLPVAAQDNRVVRQDELVSLDRAMQSLARAQAGLANAGAVKNAPYSAEATTTTTQTLSDGNRIEQSTSQKLYRDSQGRERREETLLAVGAVTQPNAGVTITISDPMERVSYKLNPQTLTAQRTPGFGTSSVTYQGATRTFVFPTYAADGANMTVSPVSPAEASGSASQIPLKKEDLGMQTIEGVTARGTRTTATIPAGQIGNLLPINIVDEVWYSPDLKMNVLTTHTDPRSGEVVYKLTNINRGEQPRSLFEPPADYTVTGPGQGGRGPAVYAPAPQK